MYLKDILCILGLIYIFDILNRNLYKVLPKISINRFFIRKLKLKNVTSLKEYIFTNMKIYFELKKLHAIKEDDICLWDRIALQELKYFLNNDLKSYLKSVVVNDATVRNIVLSHNNHIRCELKNGILDFYLLQNRTSKNSITMKFESFSKDRPILEVSLSGGDSVNTYYTYKVRNKYYRFINPSLKIFSDIRNIVNSIALDFNQSDSLLSLKAA